MKGISTNRYSTQAVNCIKQSEYEFIIRYYSRTTRQPEKVILPEEAKAIADAGLFLAVVYQDLSNYPGYFTRTRGEKDGQYAYQYATQKIGQPTGSVIYFAVDYDATSNQIKSGIRDYFQGVKQGFENSDSGQMLYDIGIYGSGLTCRWLRANLPFVKYSWLALATKWNESDTYADWNIKQIKATENLCRLPADDWQRVEVNSNFGQFIPKPT